MQAGSDLWLGIDTGGTYTDAVLMQAGDHKIVATAKSLTHHHALVESLRSVIDKLLHRDPTAAKHIRLVSISTTLATNAIVEGQGSRICSLLIGYDEEMAKRARLSEWGDPYYLIGGGHDGHGEEKVPLDKDAIRKIAQRHKEDVDAFAISSLFSVRNHRHESMAREIIQSIAPLPVSCGHELTSQLDAPRRALTTSLNARLIPKLRQLIEATRQTLKEEKIEAKLMVVRGDGSLLSAEQAMLHPVETILSGPAASLMGMQFLTGLDNFILSDIGGTTTDIAILKNGLPKQNEMGAEIGGYRTMVRAIDVHSFGLGGDSEIHFHPKLHLGPKRVVPIALLAQTHPEILTELKRQLQNEERMAHPASFLVKPDAGKEPLFRSRAERDLYSALPSSPISLAELSLGPSSLKALHQLVARGALTLCGVTPSDAQHVQGGQHNWSAEASHLALQILAKIHRPGSDYQNLALEILEEVLSYTCRLLLDTALDRPPVVKDDFASSLIQGSAEGRHNHHFVNYSFALSLPLAAAGAGAHLYYPKIAARLGTELHLSKYSALANAIGAAVGSINTEVEILVSQPKPGLYRVHWGDYISDFDDEQAALDLAEQKSRQRAADLATENGAFSPRITSVIERKDMEAGRLLEARAIARAFGKPYDASA